MSVHYSNLVWKHSTQKGGRKLLLLAIANYADDAGYCWPSQETLAEDSTMSRRHVIRMIEAIEQDGELLVVRRKRGNRYAVNVWAPSPEYLEGQGSFCDRCNQPHGTLQPLEVKAKAEPVTINLCPKCHKATVKLMRLGFRHALHRLYSDKMSHSAPDGELAESDTDVTSDVTPCHIESDIAMSHDPPLTNQSDPSQKDSGADAPPSDDDWLTETRITGESELGEMSDAERAQVASPVGTDPPTKPTFGNWKDVMVKAKGRFAYNHDYTEQDVLTVIETFTNLSGIKPPLVKAEARRWHAGTVTLLYNGWSQFRDLDKETRMRHILWCIQLFFQDYSPLSFVTPTSPHSLINLMGKLAAELRAIQKAYDLGDTLPTETLARAYYDKSRTKTPHRNRKAKVHIRPAADLDAMRKVIAAGNGGTNPLVEARNHAESQ